MSKKLLSSKEAGILTGYTGTYIRQLCRLGKIKAEKIGRDWTMTEAAIKHLIKESQDGKCE